MATSEPKSTAFPLATCSERKQLTVLLYNYTQPDEALKAGGGVSVYLNNLTKELVSRSIRVILLSSGDRYSLLSSTPRLVVTFGQPNRAIIFNSPVLAPFYFNFEDVRIYCTSNALDALPAALREHFGDIDILHFHNIEGLTLGFFKHLRKQFSSSRILLSAHNYNVVCPQVNLWQQERRRCEDFDEGRNCVACRAAPHARDRAITLRRLRTFLGVQTNSAASSAYLRVNRLALRLLKRHSQTSASAFSARSTNREIKRNPNDYLLFRHSNLDLCKSVFDTVLAVSERTKEVLALNGVPRSKIEVSYIGTNHYHSFIRSEKRLSLTAGLHVAYLGYMRLDKGFYFLLDCLESFPEREASDISVTIAATAHDVSAVERIKNLRRKFRLVKFFDGYTHSDLVSILQDVNLGVVPVLWEDNLPQVAIEMVSHGIPILTSDRGGAREIAANDRFTFRAESVDDFRRVISDIRSSKVRLADFWSGEMRLLSMDQHVSELITRFYSPSSNDWQES